MIYIVTKGEYSCYRVVAATTDRKTAEKICDKFNRFSNWSMDRCHIEEYPDAEVFLKNVWNVYFKKNGEVWKCEEPDSDYDYKRVGRITDTIYKSDYDLIITVEADTPDDAIKIAAEKRAKHLAETYGL